MTSEKPSQSSKFGLCCACGDQNDTNKQVIVNLQQKNAYQTNSLLFTPPPGVKIPSHYIMPKVNFTYSSPDPKNYIKNQNNQNSTKIGQSEIKSYFQTAKDLKLLLQKQNNKHTNSTIQMAQSSYKWIQSSKKEEPIYNKIFQMPDSPKIFSNLSRQSRRSSRKSLHDHQESPKKIQPQINDLLLKKLGNQFK